MTNVVFLGGWFLLSFIVVMLLLGECAVVGFSVTVVKNNPTKCATTRQTKTGKLGTILFRGGTVNKIYLGRKYVPAGALLCSTGVLSDVGGTSGCNIFTRSPSFSLSGVVDHGSGAIGVLANNIGVAIGSCKIAVIRGRTFMRKRRGKLVHVIYSKRTCFMGCLLMYANSSAIVPPVPKLTRISC